MTPELHDRFVRFIRTFPTLRDAESMRDLQLEPFDAGLFDRAIIRLEPGDGMLNAARFVLHVWNSSHAWNVGGFNCRQAWGSWDNHHQRAFRDFWLDPVWP